MAADLDLLTFWYETAPAESVAGRFRAAVRRQTATENAKTASDLPSEPIGSGTSADPRLAGLDSWSDLAAFVEGYARGRDPAGTDEAGTVRTTPRSLWNGSACEGCGHTFRAGDTVRVEPGIDGALGTVVHHDPDFPCPGLSASRRSAPVASPPIPGLDSVLERFAAALAHFFPLGPGLKAVRMTPRHYHLGQPRVTRRRTCMGCAHTVRLGERVVRCPCGLPAKLCLNAVHHDPARGFTCYTDWVAYPKWRERCGNPVAPGQEPEAGRP